MELVCNFELLGSSNLPASASILARTTSVGHQTQLTFLFLFFERQGLIMLLRLASNSWPQVIFLSRSLKVPRLQV